MENELIQNQWKEEIAGIKQRIAVLDEPQGCIAFYGSSSIRLWENMASDLFPLKTLNLGFGGSTYKDCVQYFQELFSLITPKQIVLYGGDNDVVNGENPQAILHNVQQLTKEIKDRFPKQTISLISIKPSPSRAIFLDRVQETNRLLKRHLQEIGGHYIDVYSAMLDSLHQPNKMLFLEDELHLNKQGYQLWATIIKKALKDF